MEFDFISSCSCTSASFVHLAFEKTDQSLVPLSGLIFILLCLSVLCVIYDCFKGR